MAFDRSRPVQWKRLLIEWAVVCVSVGVMMLLWDNLRTPGNVGFLVFGGAVYLGFGWLLAKLGYQRQRVRWDRARTPQQPAGTPARPAPRAPSPTKRTNAGNRGAKRR